LLLVLLLLLLRRTNCGRGALFLDLFELLQGIIDEGGWSFAVGYLDPSDVSHLRDS
jgi:hypothetical protein